MKRFYNMNEDERRVERMRRLPLLVKAFRDMHPSDIRVLVGAALCCVGRSEAAKAVLP